MRRNRANKKRREVNIKNPNSLHPTELRASIILPEDPVYLLKHPTAPAGLLQQVKLVCRISIFIVKDGLF